LSGLFFWGHYTKSSLAFIVSIDKEVILLFNSKATNYSFYKIKFNKSQTFNNKYYIINLVFEN